MKLNAWIAIFVLCVSACSADARATASTSDEHRKEGWRVFGQTAGVGVYVDRLVKTREEMDSDGLITVRIVDEQGKGIPYSRITFVDRDERTTRYFHEAATDRDGYAYCDMIPSSFSINAQVFSFVPETKTWRFQSRKIEKLHKVQDKPVITIKWLDFPEGTGKVKGSIRDQHGRPLKDFTLSIRHREGPLQTWEESSEICIKQQFSHPAGHFEVGNLARIIHEKRMQ